MKLSAHSRREAEAMALPEVPHLVVSISTPHEPPANIVPGVSSLGVLKLQFYDMDRIIEGYNDILKDGMFNVKHARLILDFVRSHPDTQQVIVHCDGGLSRSPGVAAALAHIVNGDDSELFQRHSGLNRHVYRTILDVHYG